MKREHINWSFRHRELRYFVSTSPSCSNCALTVVKEYWAFTWKWNHVFRALCPCVCCWFYIAIPPSNIPTNDRFLFILIVRQRADVTWMQIECWSSRSQFSFATAADFWRFEMIQRESCALGRSRWIKTTMSFEIGVTEGRGRVKLKNTFEPILTLSSCNRSPWFDSLR